MTPEKIYCIHCGAENKPQDETCCKCGKKLNEKENLFRDFLMDHVKDEVKGKLGDGLFDAVKGWLMSHLYGCLVTISLVAAVSTGVAAAAAGPESVAQRPADLPPYEEPVEPVYPVNPPSEDPSDALDLNRASWDYFKNIVDSSTKFFEETYMKYCYCSSDLPDAVDACVIHRTDYLGESNIKNDTYIGSVVFSDDSSASVAINFVDGEYLTTYTYRDGSICTVYPDGRVEGELRENVYQ